MNYKLTPASLSPRESPDLHWLGPNLSTFRALAQLFVGPSSPTYLLQVDIFGTQTRLDWARNPRTARWLGHYLVPVRLL